MSKIKSKGTVLQLSVATVYTAVSQVISLDGPNMEQTSYNSNTLDAGAGIPYDITGDSEGGSVSGELFFDPVLAIHLSMLALITTPAKAAWKILFADSAATDWTFAGAGLQFGPKAALGDGLKAAFSIKLDGIPTF